MNLLLRILFITFLQLSLITGFAQTSFRGMVVDSLSVDALPGVHVKIKNSMRGVITDQNGIFTIKASQTDTLLLTLVGYEALELPLLFEEDVLMIRLHENIRMLREITIHSTRIQPNTVIRTTRTMPRPIASASPLTSPFDYFSKWQREKRKLLKLIQENDRTITYLQVVSDEEVREVLMVQYSLNEAEYYNLLAKFNQQSAHIQYATDPKEIITELKSFLDRTTR